MADTPAPTIEAQLRAAGMAAGAAAAKAAMFLRVRRGLEALASPAAPPPAAFEAGVRAWYVPGRIEVLGKHTDYAGGRSLLCAAERGFCLLASPRADTQVRLFDVDWRSRAQFALGAPAPAGVSWAIYPATVAQRLVRDFPGMERGADIAFASDLPRAAGMSSSSALVIASFFALAAANRLEASPRYQAQIRGRESLAGYLAAVESGRAWGGFTGGGGVGTHGGSEDHTAILCCQAGRLSQYRFCPVEREREVPMPSDHVFVVGVSGVAAAKTGDAREPYNRLARAAEAIVAQSNQATGRRDDTLKAALDTASVGPLLGLLRDDPGGGFTRADLVDRLEQFVTESESLVPDAAQAFADGRLDGIGAVAQRSQETAARCLRNQIPPTMALALWARSLGAVAASAFGAGFGGAVWALVPQAKAAAFKTAWRTGYCSQFLEVAPQCLFFVTAAGPAALELRWSGGAEVSEEAKHGERALEST